MQFLCFRNNTVKGMRGISVKSHSGLRLMESGHGIGPLGSAKKRTDSWRNQGGLPEGDI